MEKSRKITKSIIIKNMALYTSKGTISFIGEVMSGTSQNGYDWARQTIVIDIPGYQGSVTKLSLQASNEMVNTLSVYNEGDKVEVAWAIYAREWNGKFYNNVDLIKIIPQEQPEEQRPSRSARPAPSAPQTKNIPPQELDPAAHDDDLPW